LSQSYVSIDLECTGLSPESDAIIEIGAVRFDESGVRETFVTFVNPLRPLPYRIHLLTGIDEEDLLNAPEFDTVSDDLESFIGNDPVVGHNIGFDLSFLSAAGVFPPGPAFDTRELATLIMPGQADYSLYSLTRRFGIDFPVRHRALPDAMAAKDVFLALVDCLRAIPIEVLAEIDQVTANSIWPPKYLFHQLFEERQAEQFVPLGLGKAKAERPHRSQSFRPLAPNSNFSEIDEREVLAVLNAARNCADAIPNYEERPEQAAMAQAVAEAINDGESLIVEAGTGVGKSLAYLIAAASYALANNARVVISTNTINLQEQLTNKDIPLLQRLLSEAGCGDGLATSQLKGRRNYLCLRRFTAMRRTLGNRSEEARMLVRLLLWLLQTETGDRSELNLRQEEEALWSRFSAQDSGCFVAARSESGDGCFLLKARQRAEAAHLLVVNHSLLLSDIASGNRVLPPYDVLIVDEAHHLEDEATRQLGFEAEQGALSEHLDRLQRSDGQGGLVNTVRQSTRGVEFALGPQAYLNSLAQALSQTVLQARDGMAPFFESVRRFLRYHAEDGGDYDRRLRLTRAQRVQPDWERVEATWDYLRRQLTHVEEALGDLHSALEEAEAQLASSEEVIAEASALLQTGPHLRDGIGGAIEQDDRERIAWLRESRDGVISIAWAPLNVSKLLQERLYSDKRSVIFTSATLSTERKLHYLKERTGLSEARELLLGSPFDYKRAALVLLPRSFPEPGWPGYQEHLERAIVDLCRASNGRALVLFTSHAALRTTRSAIEGLLEREHISVLGQGIDGSARLLLDTLRRDPQTVLLGTASFWEGVDVIGENLSLLIIARLPFSVPTEPVFAARSELFDDPFTEYAVPQAVLRFKQGFGRLIRSKSDRGVVVVLDQRLTSKPYGRIFLDSLPPSTVVEANLNELPTLAANWLGRKER
jgi:DNA polymerase-3 subunit epsilon/ATP-dependent DNA helicase DinG